MRTTITEIANAIAAGIDLETAEPQPQLEKLSEFMTDLAADLEQEADESPDTATERKFRRYSDVVGGLSLKLEEASNDSN